eukprot:365645-Chlamydomonas_euryale.AAC.8
MWTGPGSRRQAGIWATAECRTLVRPSRCSLRRSYMTFPSCPVALLRGWMDCVRGSLRTLGVLLDG